MSPTTRTRERQRYTDVINAGGTLPSIMLVIKSTSIPCDCFPLPFITINHINNCKINLFVLIVFNLFIFMVIIKILLPFVWQF